MTDTQTIEQLFRDHASRAMRLAVAMVGNEHDAEDVLQNAAATALNRAGRLDEAPGFPWLARVIVNEARNFRRVRARRRKREAQPMSDPPTVPAGEQAALLELARCARQELENLPAREREAVALLHVSGLKVRDAAAAAGVARSTLCDRAQRGLEMLRKRLDADDVTTALCLPLLPMSEPLKGWLAAADGWLAAGDALRPVPAAVGAASVALWWKLAAGIVLAAVVVDSVWFFRPPPQQSPNPSEGDAVLRPRASSMPSRRSLLSACAI